MASTDGQPVQTPRRLAPRAGAAAFGVALTLPLGLAGPADAMNVCACGGGGTTQAEDPSPEPPVAPHPVPPRRTTPAPGPANPTIAVDTAKPKPPPVARPTADDRREPKPQVAPKPPVAPPTADDRRQPMQAAPKPKAAPKPEAAEPPPPVREPTAPVRPQTVPSPQPQAAPSPAARAAPAPKATPAPDPSAAPRPANPTIAVRPPTPTPQPLPSPTADDRREPTPTSAQTPAVAPDDDLAKLLLEPTLKREGDRPAARPEATRRPTTEPPALPSSTDRLVKELTDPKPQPEPSRYLSDLLLPGVDIGSQPRPKSAPSTPSVGTKPAPPRKSGSPAGRTPSDNPFADYYRDTLNPPPPPRPIGKRPDLRDVDPITADEFVDSPLSTPFYSEADRQAARDRLREDDLVVDGLLSPADDRNPDRNEFRTEHADPEPPPPKPVAEPERSGLDTTQEVLDWAGFLPVVGVVPDVVNTGIYVGRGKWTDAAWGLGGAVPFVGDAAKGVRKGRKIVHAIDEAERIEKAADAARALDNLGDVRRVATPGSPAASTDNFLAGRPKIDSSPESKSALDGIFERTQSGTRANASHPGQFTPSHTRGHSSELRTLDDLAARSDVAQVIPIPAARGSRTPDFVVTDTAGNRVRVEVTTVTGAGRGRAARGLGGAEAPTQRDIAGAINRKTSTSSATPNQFQADLPGVPKGGTLAVHLRGGGDAAAADAAVRQAAANLERSGVNSVEIYTAEHKVLRYVRGADGQFSR